LCEAFWFYSERRKSAQAVEELGEPSQNYPGRPNLRRLAQFYGEATKNLRAAFQFYLER
jgi:hypothetical protein